LRSQYEGEIKHVDDLIKDLITFLKENNLDRKTLIIMTYDHGEDLFEHVDANGKTILGHGYYVYNTESHVPFILWMPGKIPSGLRIPYQVSLVDILPTISDFLNLTVPDDIQGESLLPVIHNQDYDKERFVFCEANKQICVKSEKFKYLKYVKKNIQELFLYADDPFEENNRIKEEPALTAKAKQLFSDFNANCESLKIKKGLIKTEETVELDDKDLEKLKALGYIE